MNRGADPLAIRTHRAWQPYSYVSRTQRSTVRQLMHGHIRPMERRRDPSAKFFICTGLAIALLFVGELIAGAFR